VPDGLIISAVFLSKVARRAKKVAALFAEISMRKKIVCWVLQASRTQSAIGPAAAEPAAAGPAAADGPAATVRPAATAAEPTAAVAAGCSAAGPSATATSWISAVATRLQVAYGWPAAAPPRPATFFKLVCKWTILCQYFSADFGWNVTGYKNAEQTPLQIARNVTHFGIVLAKRVYPSSVQIVAPLYNLPDEIPVLLAGGTSKRIQMFSCCVQAGHQTTRHGSERRPRLLMLSPRRHRVCFFPVEIFD
jgi:hypothetical protein